jgi:dihydropyrimidinase
VFQTFSSDHCPFRYDDPKGKLTPNARTSFRWVPNGIPGVETRLPILFSEGVSKGRITLQKFVELTATNHARIYGLYPRKGSIGIGFDADIVLWDPKLKKPIRQADLHHGSDYTPWEGFDVTGWPVTTIARGRVVYEQGKIVGDKGAGEVLSRGKSSLV